MTEIAYQPKFVSCCTELLFFINIINLFGEGLYLTHYSAPKLITIKLALSIYIYNVVLTLEF